MSALLFAVLLVSIGILLCLSAFFSACETVLLSLSPIQIQRIREKNRQAGDRVVKLLEKPEVALSTILIGNTFANAAIASIAYALLHRLAILPARYEEIASIIAITALVLLFGEISPKQYAIRHVEQLAPLVSRVVAGFIPPLYPLTFLLQKLIEPFKKKFIPETRAVSDEELVSVVELGQERGELDTEESAMIQGIMRLSELNASDIMTPRVDLVGVDLSDPPQRHLEIIRRAPFPYLPVWRDTPDHITDFVDTSAYLLDPGHDLQKALLHRLATVPENISLDDLIITLYRQRQHITCVVDEYGGTAGIVTRGDILELLSLDVEDDPNAPPEIRPAGPRRWVIDGAASLEQINFQLDTHLEADDADRISGWVTFHAGKIPRTGETIEADSYRVTIQKMRRRKILTVLLEDLSGAASALPPAPGREEDDEEEEMI